MHAISKGCKLLDQFLLWSAGICLTAIFIAIICDVILRNLGFQPPAFTLAVTEYGMFFITMATAPVLVRQGEHISVDVLADSLDPANRQNLITVVRLICIAICFVLSWYAFSAALDSAARGEIDIRSIDLPRWILYAILGTGLFLSGLEFILLVISGNVPSRDDGSTLGSL